jgi:hypothetical protein
MPNAHDLDLDVLAVRPALALEAHVLGDRDPDVLACGPQLERPTGGERKGDVRQALRSLSTRDRLLVVELGHAASLRSILIGAARVVARRVSGVTHIE